MAGFASFTVGGALAHFDQQNLAFRHIQVDAAPWLRRLQAGANGWAEIEMAQLLADLPDHWFRFRLPSGQITIPDGIRTNCLNQVVFAVVALTSLDEADANDVSALYTTVEPLVPIKQVFALAGT